MGQATVTHACLCIASRMLMTTKLLTLAAAHKRHPYVAPDGG